MNLKKKKEKKEKATKQRQHFNGFVKEESSVKWNPRSAQNTRDSQIINTEAYRQPLNKWQQLLETKWY